ncbi:MAG: hypothetical protein B2I17_06630 [Thermoplasmatales archaeon B_DKE]|nr:MAG: hypothetical protein B2I17_06630 [Thermoplasmatales archaeon B_DKE]
MIKRKSVVAILMSAILVSLGGYTLASSVSEPHLPSPVLTSPGFARAITIAEINDSLSGLGYGSPSTLFFHNFTLDGSSASYGFSFSMYGYDQYFYGSADAFMILVTKVNQSIGFPYLGTFLLRVYTSNVTILINETKIYPNTNNGVSVPNYLTESPSQLAYNDSINRYYFEFLPLTPFTINKTVLKSMPGIPWVYGNSYNVTYSLEVAPVIEFGPYYVIGPTQWISHTVQIPFVNQ